MGIFSKTRDVKDADIAEMLAKSDDPLKLARMIISEMEDTLVEARSTAVRALARRKELQRNAEQLQERARDWEAKAELALRKDREDLARGALAMKARTAEELAVVHKALPVAEQEVRKLDAEIAELRTKLADARNRQRLLALRGESAAQRGRIQRQLAEPKAARALDALDQSERAVDRLEAEVESYALGDRALAAQFATLETDGAVEADLKRLREKLDQSKPGPGN